MTDVTQTTNTEVAVLQRRLRIAQAQLAVYQNHRFAFDTCLNAITNHGAQQRLLLMFDHCFETAYYAPDFAERERTSLVHCLPLIFEADQLWPDGQLGLGGVSGFTFGIIPFPIQHDNSRSILNQPVEWSAHS